MANTYSAKQMPIPDNQSKPKKGWGKDIGVIYGRADEKRRHVADGTFEDYQARHWGRDVGCAKRLYLGDD